MVRSMSTTGCTVEALLVPCTARRSISGLRQSSQTVRNLIESGI